MGILQIYDTGSGYKLIDPETTETGGGGTSGAVTLDLTAVRNFDVTATGGITWTFANTPTGRRLTTTFKLILVNGGLGTQTWPASVTWLSGSSPTLKSSGTNILQFTTKDNGTTWLGADITPASASGITSANATTGFSLNTAGINSASGFAMRTAGAVDSAENLRIQYSNNGGTTWTNLVSFGVGNWYVTTLGKSGPGGGIFQVFEKYDFFYNAGIWYVRLQLTESNQNSGPTSVAQEFIESVNAALVPTAATIYRINHSAGTWVHYF